MKIFSKLIFPAILISSMFNVSCNAQSERNTRPIAANEAITASENKTKTFDISSYFNGYNAQMMRGPAWRAEGFIEKVKGLNPGIIRYPGGTVSSYWDWKTGWLKDDVEIRKEWRSITTKNPILLEDLKFACDQTGATPLYVVNMMTSTISYQIEMLKYARQIGLEVSLVELDNEFYLGDPVYVKKYPTGRDYAIEANKWIAAIKKEFPGVRIGVIGNSVKEGAAKKNKKHSERTNNWNREVLSVIRNADAMTFHIYGGTGLNYIAKVKQQADEDSESIDNAAVYQSALENPLAPPLVLGIPFMRWNSSAAYDYKILPAGMKAWITEYNLFEREGVVAGTWAHGLYSISQTLLFMENPSSELICYHNLTTTAQFAAIFNNDQAFMKAFKKKNVKAFDYTAAGYCLELSGKAMKDAGRAIKLNFSDNIQLDAARGQKYPGLNGWVIKRKSGKRIIVTNLSPKTLTVDFSDVIQGGTYSQVSSEPVKQITNESDIVKVKGNGEKINLAPYSVTLIEGE